MVIDLYLSNVQSLSASTFLHSFLFCLSVFVLLSFLYFDSIRFIYIGYTTNPQIRMYSQDGTTEQTLIALNDDIADPRGMYVNEISKYILWANVL